MVDKGIEDQKTLSKAGINISNHHLIVGSPSNVNLNLNSNSSRLLPGINNLQFTIGSGNEHHSRLLMNMTDVKKHRKNN